MRREPDPAPLSPAHVTRPSVVRSAIITAPARDVWDLLGNLRRHERLIPLTTIDAPDRLTRPGDLIVALSALVLVDRMVTTSVSVTKPRRTTFTVCLPALTRH